VVLSPENVAALQRYQSAADRESCARVVPHVRRLSESHRREILTLLGFGD
jgi:hypothetical protein